MGSGKVNSLLSFLPPRLFCESSVSIYLKNAFSGSLYFFVWKGHPHWALRES